MSGGEIINCTLVVIGILGLVMGLSYFIREKLSKKVRVFMLSLGISVFLWCTGYGLMGFSKALPVAFFFREFGLAGVVGFVSCEVFFVCYLAGFKKVISRIIGITHAVLSFVDFCFFGQKGSNIFVRGTDRTSYYAVNTLGRNIHYIYVITSFVLLLILVVFWGRVKKPKREKVFMALAIFANVLLLAATAPDTFLPIYFNVSIPTSGYGAFLCYAVIWFGAIRNNAFDITIQNLGKYIYESVNEAVLLFDRRARLEIANGYSGKLVGYDVKKGLHLSEIFDVSKEYEKQLLTTESADEKIFDPIRTFTRKSGISCELVPSVVYDRYGEIYCIICMVHDMRTTDKLIETSNAANIAKSQFLANMSHEIRTPINTMLGMNELIERESTDSTILGYADDIASAGNALLALINDILDFSKIESGRIQIIPVHYDLQKLITDTYDLVAFRAADKNLKLEVMCADNLPCGLIGDEVRIRQIMINLLTNAIKYTPQGIVQLRISGDIEHADSEINSENTVIVPKGCDYLCLKITVTDTGIGIKKEAIPELFENFTRLERSRNRHIEGTGLGLPITKQLTELMCGQIGVESTYGSGSEFTCIIPQLIDDMRAVGHFEVKYRRRPEKRNKYQALFTAPDAKVLVVDDVETNLTVFKGLMKKTKIIIDSANSGFEALKLAAENKYDIIFMDHMMPEMDGIETLKRMRENPDAINYETPVIMLTANAVSGAKDEYLSEGFSDYISKPLRGDALESITLKYLTDAAVMENAPAENAYDDNGSANNAEDLTNADSDVNDAGNFEEDDEMEKLEIYRPFLDVDAAMPYCADDPELFVEVAKSYYYNDHTKELNSNFEKLDFENYRIKVHSLKSTSVSIGATEVSKLAIAIDTSLKSGDTGYAKEHHRELMIAYRKVIDGLAGVFEEKT